MPPPTVSPPSNNTYTTGNILTFTLTYASAVTVNTAGGTPYLALSALGSGSIGTSNVAQASYQSGSGTTALTFTYTVQSTDSAPTSGISMASSVTLNGGTITGGVPCFTAANLTGVLIGTPYLWVSDFGNNRILKFTLTGTFISGYGAGYNGIGGSKGNSGSADGKFSNPLGMAIDSSGNVWVVDGGNNRVEKISSSGQWLMTIGGQTTTDTCAGTYATSTTCNNLTGYSNCCKPNATSCTCTSGNANGQFNIGAGIPAQLTFDASGNIWVTDFYNNRIQEFSSTGAWLQSITTSNPSGIAVNNGYIWVANPMNTYISKCTSGGSCTTYGTGVLKQNSDTPSDYIAVDGSGNIWIADQDNSRLDEFNSSGSFINHIATSGSPAGVAIDSGGNIWYSNDSNNTVVQMTTSGATLQTFSTTGTSPSSFNAPQNLVVTR